MELFENLFTFNAYWKVALFVIVLGSGLAYAITQGVNSTGKRMRAGLPDPPWWGALLRVIALVLGTGIGLAVDLSVQPLVPEGATASAPLLSAILGLFSGAFCTAIVWVIKSKLVKRVPELARAPLDGTFTATLPPDGDLSGVEEKAKALAENVPTSPEDER